LTNLADFFREDFQDNAKEIMDAFSIIYILPWQQEP
jgi:hypothetical protein